jgi:hypothetical protein
MYLATTLKSVLGSQSSGDVTIDVILAVILAIVGYRLSQRTRVVRGVTPWRIPSAAWAIICLLFSALGILLELIAVYLTRSVQNQPTQVPPAYTPTSPPPMHIPTVPMPGTTEEVLSVYVPKVPASGFGGPESDALGKPALFGWYKDVSGHHEMRYWDGRDWTKLVSDSGVTGEDPLTS